VVRVLKIKDGDMKVQATVNIKDQADIFSWAEVVRVKESTDESGEGASVDEEVEKCRRFCPGSYFSNQMLYRDSIPWGMIKGLQKALRPGSMKTVFDKDNHHPNTEQKGCDYNGICKNAV
jgi:hypothetical protein